MNSKYKYKYLKYGGKISEIKNRDVVDFLDNASFDEIKKKLFYNMNNKKYCNRTIGEGSFGKVYVQSVGDVVEVNISNNKNKEKIVKIPVVIKKGKNEGNYSIFKKGEITYITGNLNITLEAIILSFANKLINKIPHLPRLIGYSMCNNNENVTNIVVERYGTKEKIKTKKNKDIFDIYKYMFGDEETNDMDLDYISTIYDLQLYVNKMLKGDEIILPNKRKCNIGELYDYITISIMMTHEFLGKTGIYVGDLHTGNIFIQWLDENSYYDEKCIENVENIIYEFGNKLIKIKTFGFIIKFGDIGMSFIKRKNYHIYGQLNETSNYNHILQVDKILDVKFLFLYFFYDFISNNNNEINKKTSIYNLLELDPYDKYKNIAYFKLGDLDKMKSYEYIIDKYFSKYFVANNNYDNSLFIKI